MVTAEGIRELLTRRPFRPFRLVLADGSSHEVPRPEWAKVFGGRVFIGVAAAPGAGAGAAVKGLAILDVARIEELAPPKGKPERL